MDYCGGFQLLLRNVESNRVVADTKLQPKITYLFPGQGSQERYFS